MCLEVYKDHQVIPCVHRLCLTCLENVSVAFDENIPKCPLCIEYSTSSERLNLNTMLSKPRSIRQIKNYYSLRPQKNDESVCMSDNDTDSPLIYDKIQMMPEDFPLMSDSRISLNGNEFIEHDCLEKNGSLLGNSSTKPSREGKHDIYLNGSLQNDQDVIDERSCTDTGSQTTVLSCMDECSMYTRCRDVSKTFVSPRVPKKDKSPLERKVRKSESYCECHPGFRVDQYCTDCNVTACGTCLLQNHRHHNLVDLCQQAQLSRQQIENIIKQTKIMLKLIDEQIHISVKHDKQASADVKNAKDEIEKVVDGMISILIQQKTQLFLSLNEILRRKEKAVKAVRKGQNLTRSMVTGLKSCCERLLQHDRAREHVQQAKDIQSRLMRVNASKLPSFKWCSRENKEKSPENDLTVARVSLKTDMSQSTDVARTYHAMNNVPLIMKKSPVIGMVAMEETLWVVHSAHYNLYALPTKSSRQSHIFPIHGLARPADMVQFPSGQSQLVISDYEKHSLLWVKVQQRRGVWRVTSQTSQELQYTPWGLGVLDNQLLVCDGDVIHTLSASGEETRRFNTPSTVKPIKAVAFSTSTSCPSFKIVVKDSHNKQVALLNEDGIVQKIHQGHRGFRPGDIACQAGCVYVTDHDNDRVDELGDDCRHLRQMGRNNQCVTKPTRVCVDTTGHIYVAHCNGEEQVSMIDTVSNVRQITTYCDKVSDTNVPIGKDIVTPIFKQTVDASDKRATPSIQQQTMYITEKQNISNAEDQIVSFDDKPTVSSNDKRTSSCCELHDTYKLTVPSVDNKLVIPSNKITVSPVDIKTEDIPIPASPVSLGDKMTVSSPEKQTQSDIYDKTINPAQTHRMSCCEKQIEPYVNDVNQQSVKEVSRKTMPCVDKRQSTILSNLKSPSNGIKIEHSGFILHRTTMKLTMTWCD